MQKLNQKKLNNTARCPKDNDEDIKKLDFSTFNNGIQQIRSSSKIQTQRVSMKVKSIKNYKQGENRSNSIKKIRK